MHSTSTMHSGGSLSACWAYKMSCGEHQVDKSVCFPSQLGTDGKCWRPSQVFAYPQGVPYLKQWRLMNPASGQIKGRYRFEDEELHVTLE